MNTLILFLDGEHEWSPIDWVIQRGGTRGADGQCVIEDSSGWISVLRYEAVLREYEEDEAAVLSTLSKQPVPFLIEWKGSDLIGDLLKSVPEDCNAVVDNDHGLIAPLAIVCALPVESWLNPA